MAENEKGILQTILENLRDAAVRFGQPFQPPGDIPQALRDLLKELGIDNPGDSVSNVLGAVAAKWAQIAKDLQNLQFNFLNPAQAIAGLAAKAKTITDGIDAIKNAPGAVAGIAGNVAAVFPERLIGYILYEFITSSHPKIGGIFLLLGVLRKDPHPASPGLLKADVRVFDFAQLVAVISDPKKSFKKVLAWGDDKFNARPIVDGMALLGDLIQPGDQIGPKDDTFPLADEVKFVAVTAGAEPSARRTLTVNAPGGPFVLSFVGLHKHGVGLLVPQPINASGGVGSMTVAVPAGVILALTPDGSADADPRVAVFS